MYRWPSVASGYDVGPAAADLQEIADGQILRRWEDPILEQYVTSAAALVDDEDEEDEGGGVAGDDEYTSNVENKTPSDGSSESEFFSVDEDVQSSDGAVAGSDAGSPTPFYPAPISPVAAITVTSPRASHPGSPRTQGSVSHMAPFPRSEGNLFQACYGSSQHQTPPQNEGGTFPTPSNPQHHTLTLSERVKRTHPLWYLPNVHRTEACRLLFDKEQGVSRHTTMTR
ncbi:hypothetical protein LSH36_1g16018 [Paralvinella palmiformis]|uniref:Uncharacterized protein n=1 Tax=Paralvinella palmiformis TaxID=53620 RepID=A0AAD9NHP5_9ANNE|nr:hypothetical protein LSH36_1g16018 [Paralvinella palmiformis]